MAMAMHDPGRALVPSDALHADAVLAGPVPLRGEYDPAEVARRQREQLMALTNIGAQFAVAATGFVNAVSEALLPAMRRITTALRDNPAWRDLMRQVDRIEVQARHEVFLARWRALTPRQRKDLLRRRRKGIRLC